jgi:hypothetical protein
MLTEGHDPPAAQHEKLEVKEMKELCLKNFTRAIVVMVVVAFAATSAFAGTQNNNATTLATTLNLSANVQTALRLTLSAGTATIGGTLSSHCAIGTGTPDFTMDLGNVDALAISNGTCGGKIAPVTPGTSNAVYYSDYNITPVYTSQNPVSGTTLTEKLTTGFSGAANLTVVTAGNTSTVPAAVSDFSTLTAGGSALATAPVTSGTALTRFIGVSVAPTNGVANLTPGSRTAVITYTLTVQ